MSFYHSILGSDTDEEYSDSEKDIEIIDSNVEIITIEDGSPIALPESSIGRAFRGPGQPATSVRASQIQLPNVELDIFQLEAGIAIKVGDTVELKDKVDRRGDRLHSGAFLRVKHILKDLETDEVRLRGYLLCRTKYHGQFFDWKMNELVMVLSVFEDDDRSAFVQGMEEFPVEEVLRKRECIITHMSYPAMSFREGLLPIHLQTDQERKAHIFHKGRLTCRWVNIAILTETKRNYSGVIRGIYSREADSRQLPVRIRAKGHTPNMPIDLDEDDEQGGGLIIDHPQEATSGKRHRATNSIEEIGSLGHPSSAREGNRHKRTTSIEEVSADGRPALPSKSMRYTFGDAFCGAGGASQGASSAGLHIKWGLDKDEYAILAYGSNFPGAATFQIDAHEFPRPWMKNTLLRVDVLHLSPPCCYWSPAHTRAGQNDQANFETIYTVGPILAKIKPRVATLEQTYGLVTHGQHKKNFRQLMNDIGRAGYDIRYKIQDLSEFGLPQRRKRLLIIAARRGTPLPPFPKPTHGPAGSGLQRFKSVHDALEPLRHLRRRTRDDDYHMPEDMKTLHKTPYNPETSFLKGCVTAGGGENHHYSGTRKYTTREMSLFQSFPYSYIFTGSHGEAMKQVGNAFPPVMAEAMYKIIAQTLEAFDHGMIGPDDEIHDLDAFLEERGIKLPKSPSPSHPLLGTPLNPKALHSPYRYLAAASSGTGTPSRTPTKKLSLWRCNNDIDPIAPNTERRPAPTPLIWGNWSRNGREALGHSLHVHPKRRHMMDKERAERAEEPEANGEIIELD
ncbi:S-adenosyl-L-methionine-dependent methyltransferase [Lindgomyces ingoldianus]|uniref:S-adenosyl-L-methionine-dependent methyltransferase n=1 Tax=Lindgomyces ingoldianus TaxID=673940 RepID=A0ACB6QGG3_9PLEO|nr:S-adenosyl-L-methionine-dependent methyltransferase [Lindgomyces ingoldianus]KAF2465977.1 S-adenosyl-L-methionine-dependent methyltransferase [Lindgomyces ingoldianus]